MTPMELLLTELGEMTATQLHQGRDSKGKRSLERDAQEAGTIAGDTRKAIEEASGTKVVSSENYLPLTDIKKRLKAPKKK